MTEIVDPVQKRVLIVDDNPTNLGVLLNYLEHAGFRVLVAESGESALKRVHYVMPDIILLDVMMPGMDGFETCLRLKQNAETSQIPIIFMTALNQTEDKVRGFELGAVDYVTKPLQHAEVLARIRTHLSIYTLQAELAQKNSRLEQEMAEKQQVIAELKEALENVRTLKGMLPICASCKKIRDDKGYWYQVETYIRDHSDATFTHGICPDCAKKFLADVHQRTEEKGP